MKYSEDKIERKIVVVDNLFTEFVSHFAYVEFFLKSYVMNEAKLDNIKSIESNKLTGKIADIVVEKVKANI